MDAGTRRRALAGPAPARVQRSSANIPHTLNRLQPRVGGSWTAPMPARPRPGTASRVHCKTAAAAAAGRVRAAAGRPSSSPSADARLRSGTAGFSGGLGSAGLPLPLPRHTILARQYIFEPAVLVGEPSRQQGMQRRQQVVSSPASETCIPPVVADRRRHSSPGASRADTAACSGSGAAAVSAMPFYPAIPAAVRMSGALAPAPPLMQPCRKRGMDTSQHAASASSDAERLLAAIPKDDHAAPSFNGPWYTASNAAAADGHAGDRGRATAAPYQDARTGLQHTVLPEDPGHISMASGCVCAAGGVPAQRQPPSPSAAAKLATRFVRID